MSTVLDNTQSVERLLLPQHLVDLRGSGLSDAQILRCEFISESDPAMWAARLNWKTVGKATGPALCIPFRGVDGKPLDYSRVKPDTPRAEKSGKSIKYESPLKTANRAYFPPDTIFALTDPSKPLIITEGEKKAAKADQEGFACVGLVGVYGWQKGRTRSPDGAKGGPRELIDDLAAVIWQGRRVHIAFDSDITQNRQVEWAQRHLAVALTKTGAIVSTIRIPLRQTAPSRGSTTTSLPTA